MLREPVDFGACAAVFAEPACDAVRCCVTGDVCPAMQSPRDALQPTLLGAEQENIRVAADGGGRVKRRWYRRKRVAREACWYVSSYDCAAAAAVERVASCERPGARGDEHWTYWFWMPRWQIMRTIQRPGVTLKLDN